MEFGFKMAKKTKIKLGYRDFCFGLRWSLF